MNAETLKLPVLGDGYRCESCGMQIGIESDCLCESGEPSFECCGSALKKI